MKRTRFPSPPSRTQRFLLVLACPVLVLAGPIVDGAAQGAPPEEPGFLGVRFELEPRGAHITEVIEDTAAERAGLRRGDLVLSLGGDSLAGLEHYEMHELMAPLEAGDRVPLEVARGDEVFPVTLTLGAPPAEHRVTDEARRRFHAMLREHEGLEQFFGLVRRSSVLLLRRGDGDDLRVRPEEEDAEWEPLHPYLVEFLDRHLRGAVSELEEGQTLRFSAVEEGSGVRLKVLEVVPAS